jgi:hypothetical protein
MTNITLRYLYSVESKTTLRYFTITLFSADLQGIIIQFHYTFRGILAITYTYLIFLPIDSTKLVNSISSVSKTTVANILHV